MIENLRERTKDLTTWADLRNEYINFGIFDSEEIELEEKFSKADAMIFGKYERGEITKSEFNRLSIELDHEHTRACVKISAEDCELDEWANEIEKIIAERDAGKISAEEYWRRCFELDKKFGLADDEDADIYFGTEDDEEFISEDTHEENFSGQISAHG